MIFQSNRYVKPSVKTVVGGGDGGRASENACSVLVSLHGSPRGRPWMWERGKSRRAGELGVSGRFRVGFSHKLDSRQGGRKGGSFGRKTGWPARRGAKRT
jgi:hypothetical protein